MHRFTRVALVAGLLTSTWSVVGLACFARVELDELVRQSDLIVVGKITAIERAKPSRNATDRATIAAEQVLFGAAGKKVVLGFPGERVATSPDGKRSHVSVSTDLRYRLGQDGVWLLEWDAMAKLYRAAHPGRFQPRERLDEIKAAIAKVNDEKKAPAPPSPELMAMIECWIKEEHLNRYGDPRSTMYIGGTPLFDESTGKRTDRFEYILQRHPGLPKRLRKRYAPRSPQPPVPVEWQERIDAWLRKQKLNRYGDPSGTTYANWSPLFDEKRKVLLDRTRYLLDKFPELREQLEER